MQPLVYVDTSEVREGALGQLRDAIRALSGFVEQNEPQLVSYSVYFSDDGRQMTVVHVHADPASLDHHMVDLRDLRHVRRSAGSRRQHLVDLTEVIRRHDAGARYRKELRILGPVVVEPVDRAARHAQGFTGANVERPTVHRPGRDAVEPVDRLLEGVVAVRRGHRAVGRNEALEDARASVRIGGLDEEANAERTHLNRFRRCWSHRACRLTATSASASLAKSRRRVAAAFA